MPKNKWNYSGDMNLEYGGFYWREDDAFDYVVAVRVTPCSDGGGPDNLFLIEPGSIYLGDRHRDAALAMIGVPAEEATRRDIVEAHLAYGGMDADGSTVLQIGPAQEARGWNPKPDYVLRSNVNLRKYVEREWVN